MVRFMSDFEQNVRVLKTSLKLLWSDLKISQPWNPLGKGLMIDMIEIYLFEPEVVAILRFWFK